MASSRPCILLLIGILALSACKGGGGATDPPPPPPKPPKFPVVDARPKPPPEKDPNLVVLLAGPGDYELGLAAGQTVKPVQTDAQRWKAGFDMPAPREWRAVYQIEVRREAPTPIARFSDTRYGFLKMEPRTVDIGALQTVRCEKRDYVEAGPTTGPDTWVRKAVFWRARAEACREDEPNSAFMVRALEMTLGAEKMLVQGWPDRFAMSDDIRQLAQSALQDNPLCEPSRKSPACARLQREVSETRDLDYKLYVPLQALNDSTPLRELSKAQLTAALAALHESRVAYDRCRTRDQLGCNGAEFALLQKPFCAEAKRRGLATMNACALVKRTKTLDDE